MRKFPKTRDWRQVLGTGLTLVLAVEGLALAGGYTFWTAMNSSRDFRYKVHNYCPVILETYYWIGERFGDLPTRTLDYKAWGLNSEK